MSLELVISLAAAVWLVVFCGLVFFFRWLRRRFVEAAFRFEIFEAENREAVDEIIKRKEAEDQ